MKKNILFCTLILLIYSNAFAQRIVKSAINKYPSYNDNFYDFYNEYTFDHTFKLSDGSIVTLSAKHPNFSITKWNKDLEIIDQAETVNIKNQVFKETMNIYTYHNYHSFMFNDVIYVFSYEKINDSRSYYYYEISCANKISIEIKKENNINNQILSSKDQYVYIMNSDDSGILKINIQTLKSEKITIPLANPLCRFTSYNSVNGYLVLVFRTSNTAKDKEPANTIVETFVLQTKTDKLNKISVDFLLDKYEMTDFNVAVNNDSLYFITYSNREDKATLNYKIMGYDFGLEKVLLQKKSSFIFTKNYYLRFLGTLFFNVDPKTGNFILILDRFMPEQFSDMSLTFKKEDKFYPTNIEKMFSPIYWHVDYPVIYMNPTGDVIHDDYLYWLKDARKQVSQGEASYYPKILVVDGLVYVFVSSYRMVKMTCFVYNTDGTLKDKIVLFDKDVPDSDNVNTSTITYVGDGVFSLATIPNQFGQTGSYYLFKVYK